MSYLEERILKDGVIFPNNEANRLREGREWGFVKGYL